MTTDILLYAFFEDSSNSDGETGLTPTIDVRRIVKADLTSSLVVNNQAMTEIGGGLYGYRMAAGDLQLYDYLGVAKTVSGAVVSKHVPAIRWDAAERITMADIADAVWDEILAGGTHNINTSAGRRLRELAGTIIGSGVAQAGTLSTITLATGASAVAGAYDPSLIAIVLGTGAGQSRNILQYDGAARIAYVGRNWKTVPDATSEYILYADAGREHVNEGLLQDATISTATLNLLASSLDDAYNGQTLFIRAGTGDDQARRVLDYDGATKIAIVDRDWEVIPNGNSVYVMLPTGMCAETNLAVSAAEAAALADNTIPIYQSYTLDQVVTSTITDDLSVATKLWFAVKASLKDSDDESLIYIEKTDGLTRLNGAVYATTAHGSIVVSGASGAWVITLKIEEDATALLERFRTGQMEIKAIIAGDTVFISGGSSPISRRVIQAIS